MKVDEIKEKVRAAYNAVLPAPVRYDPNLTDKAKLLYAEITATTNHQGYCDKSNQYFSAILGVSARRISQFINLFVERGYFTSEVVNTIRRLQIPTKEVSYIQPPKLKDGDGIADDVKEFMDEYISTWCKEMKTKIYRPNLYYRTLLERLQEFSEEEMKTAMENRLDLVKNTEWYQQPENVRHARNIDLLIRDEKSMLKHLNMVREPAPKSDESEVKSFKIDSDKDLLN